MKIIKTQTLKNGLIRTTVDTYPNETLMAFDDEKMYRLGGQVEDVVWGNIITESDRVYWCSIEQKWVEA